MTAATALRASTITLPTTGWLARLELGFKTATQAHDKTVMSHCLHEGPLRVQKALYPEGDAVCHAIVLHPPSGVVGGDELNLSIRVESGAHAFLTSPGAAKWYRSAGLTAHQTIRFEVADHAVCEWLPQDTLVYDGAQACWSTTIALQGTGVFIGWDITGFGRTAHGETFAQGLLASTTRIERDQQLLWIERARIHGSDSLLQAAAGLRSNPVMGTLMIASTRLDDSDDNSDRDALKALARAALADAPYAGLTCLPGVLVVRCIASHARDVKERLTHVWQHLREPLTGRPPMRPRIWAT